MSQKLVPVPIRRFEEWVQLIILEDIQSTDMKNMLLERAKVVCRECFGYGHSRTRCPTRYRLNQLALAHVGCKSFVGNYRLAMSKAEMGTIVANENPFKKALTHWSNATTQNTAQIISIVQNTIMLIEEESSVQCFTCSGYGHYHKDFQFEKNNARTKRIAQCPSQAYVDVAYSKCFNKDEYKRLKSLFMTRRKMQRVERKQFDKYFTGFKVATEVTQLGVTADATQQIRNSSSDSNQSNTNLNAQSSSEFRNMPQKYVETFNKKKTNIELLAKSRSIQKEKDRIAAQLKAKKDGVLQEAQKNKILASQTFKATPNPITDQTFVNEDGQTVVDATVPTNTNTEKQSSQNKDVIMDPTNPQTGKENKTKQSVTTRSKSSIKTVGKMPPEIKWQEYLPENLVSYTNYNAAHQLKEMLEKINSELSTDDNYLVVDEKEAFVKYGAASDAVFVQLVKTSKIVKPRPKKRQKIKDYGDEDSEPEIVDPYDAPRQLLIQMATFGMLADDRGKPYELRQGSSQEGLGRPVMQRTESESSITKMLDALSMSSHLSVQTMPNADDIRELLLLPRYGCDLPYSDLEKLKELTHRVSKQSSDIFLVQIAKQAYEHLLVVMLNGVTKVK